MTQRRKITIIIIIGAIIWIGIVLFIVWLTGRNHNSGADSGGGSHIVIIDNAAEYKSSGLSDDYLSIIEPAVYTTIQNNVPKADSVYHGTIRDGTFSFAQSSDVVSFLLDIPSIKLSWYVVQGQSDPSVSCVTKEQAEWPLPDKCVDLATILTNQSSSDTPSLGDISQYLPISESSYTMDIGYSPTNSKLAILVTCYTATCQQNVEAQITSLGFSPTNYQIVYTKAY